MQKESMLVIVGILVVSVVLLFAADYFVVPTGKATEFRGPGPAALPQPSPQLSPAQPSAIAPLSTIQGVEVPGTDPAIDGCNTGIHEIQEGARCDTAKCSGVSRRCVNEQYQICGPAELNPSNPEYVWYKPNQPQGSPPHQCALGCESTVSNGRVKITCADCSIDCEGTLMVKKCRFKNKVVHTEVMRDCSDLSTYIGCYGYCNPFSIEGGRETGIKDIPIPACDRTCFWEE